MAFIKVNETTFTIAAGTGSESETLPGPPAAGDLVIIAMASDSTMTSDGISTAGYQNIEYVNNAAPGHQVAYKVMGSTPDTTVTILQNGTSMAAGVIQVWRGQNPTVLDVASTVATGSSGDPDSPSITTSTGGALVFSVGLLDDDDAASGASAPAGYTDFLAADTGQGS